jgi:predicted DNA-binding ribbon-helix-helix protein
MTIFLMSEDDPAHNTPANCWLPEGDQMKSSVIKRSVVVGGQKTSVSLEEPFWLGLKKIAENEHATLADIIGGINTHRENCNLSSAIRLFVLEKAQLPQGANERDHSHNELEKGRRH